MHERTEPSELDRDADGDAVDALLATCLDQPEERWLDDLENLCAAHPHRADELRRRFGRLVQLGIVDAPAAAGPDRVGPYRLVRRLGSGTMGVVWLAEDERLRRQVALKILRREHLFFAAARQRFRREMAAAARLDHPALCPIYDAGELDGVPFLAMRYVAGPSLAEWIAERRREHSAPDRDRVCAWVATLAHALHAVHAAGIVHRDVKPANILLDHGQQPVLLDFGLAHALEGDGAPALTATGAQLGTPAYMAPEQVRGDPVDRRTDVWALGVVLYEALTLRLPFAAAARESLFREILAGEPLPLRRVVRHLPADLVLVVATAMAKTSAERYQTAQAFAEDLEHVLRREPIAARRAPAHLRARRWVQRHPLATAVGLLLALGLAVALALVAALRESLGRSRNLLLVANARAALDEDLVLGVLLAREALTVRADVDTRSLAYAALARSRGAAFWEFDDPPRQVAWLAGDPPAMVVRTDGGLHWRTGDGAWSRLWRSDQPFDFAVAAAGRVVLALERPVDHLRAWRLDAGGLVPSDLQLGAVARFEADPHLLSVLAFTDDDDACLVDVVDPRRRMRLPIRARVARRLAFAPEGDRLAVVPGVPGPASVHVHHLDGSGRVEMRALAQGADALAFVAGGRLVVAGTDRRLRLLGPDGAEVVLPEHDAPVVRLQAAFAAPWAVTLDALGYASLWDLSTPRLRWRHRVAPGAAMDITADGLRIAVASGNLVRIFDGHDAVASVPHSSDIGSLAFAADGRRLLSSSSDRAVRVSDLSWARMPILAGHASAVRGADWSPDDGSVATACLDGRLRWFSAAGELQREVRLTDDGADSGITSVRWLRDGSLVAGGSGCLWFVDREGRPRQVALPRAGARVVARFDVAPRGEQIVNCLAPPRDSKVQPGVQLLDAAGGEVWHVPFDRMDDGLPYAVAFVGDRWVAVGDDRGAIRVLDRATGKTVTPPWPGHRAHRLVGLLVAIPGTDSFVSTGFDGVVRIWDVHGGRHGELFGHTNAVKGCAVHVGRGLLATASFDHTVRLWRLDPPHDCLAVLEGHDALVFDVRFSPDGSRLVSASWDRTARIWPTDLDALPRLLDERAVRGFRPEERARFAPLLPGPAENEEVGRHAERAR